MIKLSDNNPLDSEKRYLVDWSIPQNCEELLQNFKLPIYFSYDILQCSPVDSIYRDTWPSLFIGAAGTQSKLHIDSFGSHFWMLLISGRKKWIFYPAEDIPLLYPTYDHSFDPVFAHDPFAAIDASSTPTRPHTPPSSSVPRAAAFSLSHSEGGNGVGERVVENEGVREDGFLSRYATPFEVVLEPGELIFVPSGMPHAVMNLETSVALSGNYVDSTNLKDAISQLKLDSLTCERSRDLYEYLSNHPIEYLENRIKEVVGNVLNNPTISNSISNNTNNSNDNNGTYQDNISRKTMENHKQDDENNDDDRKIFDSSTEVTDCRKLTIDWKAFKSVCKNKYMVS